MRAAAILIVFFGHYEASAHPLLSYGWAGVDLFFALSGFLITGILYDTRDTANRFQTFYMRRTLRIFPLYYGVLLAALLTTPIFHWLWSSAWLLWLTYLGNYARFFYWHTPAVAATGSFENLVAQSPFPHQFLIYTNHFWSLCVEEQFYLVWPLVVFSIKKRETLRNTCAAVFVACLFARIACFYLLPQWMVHADFLYRVTPLRVDALLIGAFVALCLRGPEAAILHKAARPLLAVYVACFATFQFTCIAVSPQHTAYQPDLGSPVMTTIGFSLVDIFAALLVAALLTPRGVLFRVFNIGWLRRLGQVSYGFYIFHLMFKDVYAALAHWLAPAMADTTNLTAIVGLVGTTMLSFLSYRYFETPFLKLKRYFVTK